MTIPRRGGSGAVSFKVLDGATSSDDGVRIRLSEPCRYFGFQVQGASSGIATLQGSIATSSDATLTTLLTHSSAAGTILSTESTAPMRLLVATVTDASSAAGLEGWLSASP